MQFEEKQALAHKRRPVSHRVDVLPNRLAVHPGFRVGMRLFGPFEVELRGHRLGPRDFGGTKPRQILQMLAIERGHPVPKLRLAERLWGESPPRNVAATLETYVCVLRRHLSPGDDAGHGLVVTERGAYRLATERVDLDIDRFDELIRAASRREGIDSRLSCLEEPSTSLFAASCSKRSPMPRGPKGHGSRISVEPSSPCSTPRTQPRRRATSPEPSRTPRGRSCGMS